MNPSDYLLWEPDIYLVDISWFQLRWYAFLFAIAFFIGRLLIVYFHKKEGKSKPSPSIQLFVAVLGTLFGARLGHVVFYQRELLETDFLELFKFWKAGLSSHGTAFGILLAVFLFVYRIRFTRFRLTLVDRFRPENNYFQIMDRLVIGIALGAVLIRIGNLINSEIIGIPTETNYGIILLNPFTEELKRTLPFVKEVSYRYVGNDYAPGYPNLSISISFKNQPYFEERIKAGVQRHFLKMLPNSPTSYQSIFNPLGSQLDYKLLRNRESYTLSFMAVGVARHPSQLYEAVALFLVFLVLFGLWKLKGTKLVDGHILGWFLVILFSIRFAQEFLKENQVVFEKNMVFNMGQILSVPLIALGLFLLFSRKSN